MILGHCRLQHCPHQRHRWLMSTPERLTLSCLCLCPCLCGTCTVKRCDPSYRNCGLVIAVVFVLLFRLLLLLLLPFALGLTLVRPLATNLSNFHRLRAFCQECCDKRAFTTAARATPYFVWPWRCRFCRGGSGVILRRRAIFTPSFKASCAEDSQREIVSSHLLRASSNPVTLSGKGAGFRICCSKPSGSRPVARSVVPGAAKLQGHSDLHH